MSIQGGDAETLDGLSVAELLERARAATAAPTIPNTFWPMPPNGTYTPDNNTIEMFRVKGVAVVSALGISVATSDGTLCVAVCTGAPGLINPTTRVATSGSVPFPASGYAEIALDVAVAVDGNSWFALQKGSGTGTVNRCGVPNIPYDIVLGFMSQQAGAAFPIPATLTPTIFPANRLVPIVGVP